MTSTHHFNTQMKLFTSLATAAIALAAVTSIPQAKAYEYSNCSTYGSYTNCYGSNGSTYNSYGIGDNYRSYSGTDSRGNYYSGNCTRIGSYVSCYEY